MPVTAWLLDTLGWRSALAALGATLAVVALIVVAGLPNAGPATAADEPDAAADGRPHPAEHLLAGAFALQSFASVGLTVALVWFLVERGTELAAAAAVAGLAGAAQVPGRLLLAPLQRRVGSRFRLSILLVVQTAALLALASGPSYGFYAAVLVFGAAAGTITIERATVLWEWFGSDGFAARSGRSASVSAFAKAGSPFLIELLRQALGYRAVFQVLALALVAGAVVALVAGASTRRANSSFATARSRPDSFAA